MARARRSIRTSSCKITALCIAILILASCTSSKTAKVTEYIADYADAKIEIVGLLDEPFTITPAELAKLELKSGKVSGNNAVGASASASGIGPSLTTFLAQYDKKPGDFKLIRFFASDEYRITLHTISLEKYEITMAITGASGPLPDTERPMRLLIPGTDSSQWIYAVVRIEFEPLEE